MFAFMVVGVFVLMIFAAEFVKMWRRETEYRRVRARWDDDVEELRDTAWRGPGPGQRPAAPGYIAPPPPVRQRAPATPVADIQMRIKQELRAMHQDVSTFQKRVKDETAREVYPYGLDMGMAHDDGGTDDEETPTRPTH